MPDLPPKAEQAARAVLDHPWAGTPKSAHAQHRYDASCGVCRGDVPAILAVAFTAGERSDGNASVRPQKPPQGDGTPIPGISGRPDVSESPTALRERLRQNVDIAIRTRYRCLADRWLTDEEREEFVSLVLDDAVLSLVTPLLERGEQAEAQLAAARASSGDGAAIVAWSKAFDRAQTSEAAIERVREWAEKMRRTGNPDGMGAHIHATVIKLLDQPATEETDHA